MDKDINNSEVNFKDEFDRLEAYFDEMEKLLEEKDNISLQLEEALSNINSEELYGANTEECKAKFRFLADTFFEIISEWDVVNRQMKDELAEGSAIYREMDIKSNNYLSQYRERFKERFKDWLIWEVEKDIFEMRDRKINKQSFLYKIAHEIYHLSRNFLNVVEEMEVAHQAEVSKLQQEIFRAREIIDRFKKQDGLSLEQHVVVHKKDIEIIMLKSQIDDMDRAHAMELREVERHYKSELSTKESDFNNEKLGLLATIESLRAKIEELNKEIARIKEEFGEKVTDLKSSNTLLKSSIIGLAFITAALAIEVGTGFISNRFQQNQTTIEHHQEEYQENHYPQQHPLETQIEYDYDYHEKINMIQNENKDNQIID